MFREPECYYDEQGEFNCKNCLIKSDTFQYLTNKELERVADNRFQVEYKPGDVIFKQGTSTTHSISFTEGMAKVYVEDKRGDIILRIIKPTEFINGYGQLYDKMNHYSIAAITPSSACFFDSVLINAICDSNKYFREAYVAEIQQRNYFIQHRLVDLMFRKNPGRVAGLLLYLSKEIYCAQEFHLDLSREELKSLCAVSSDSLSRILSQFQDGDLIKIKGKTIKLTNAIMLDKIWQNG